MKYFFILICILCVISSTYALTPSERLNLVGSADVIVTGKVLAETITLPLRTEEPIKNISVKVQEQYKGGVKSLFDIKVSDSEPSLKVGGKYIFFLKYSIGTNNIVPIQKYNWNFIEGTDYLLLIDLIKRYPITIDITNAEATLLYSKKNFINCKIIKNQDAKVDIISVKLNLILSTEIKDVNRKVEPPALIALDKVNMIKITDKVTLFNLPLKIRNTEDKDDYQVVIQPVFYLKINGIACEYSGGITVYYISDKDF
jgi:hypothetical protein